MINTIALLITNHFHIKLYILNLIIELPRALARGYFIKNGFALAPNLNS